LADPQVAKYFNENFICTYQKVGTFRILNGQKVGGNVASYFCLWDGYVLHAVPGKVGADTLLSEARWVTDLRKSALMYATNLRTGAMDRRLYGTKVMLAHVERYHEETNTTSSEAWNNTPVSLPTSLPQGQSAQAQVDWALARSPMPQLNSLYPYVWRQILNERLSDLPVAKQ
jgi:hypothetical protein